MGQLIFWIVLLAVDFTVLSLSYRFGSRIGEFGLQVVQHQLAQQFRGTTWPETKAALDKAKQELEDLRNQLEKISTNIFSAGGGS